MKKTFTKVAVLAIALGLTACGMGTTSTATSTSKSTPASTSSSTTTASSSASTAGGVLGGLLGGSGGGVVGNILSSLFGSTLQQKDLYGTWLYSSPKVAFESENLLAKAGGAVAASTVEEKLAGYLGKVGITAGSSTFIFNEDGSYTVGSKTKTLYSGKYTFDAQNKTIKMTGLLGLATFTASVGKSGSNIYLMFDADKVLSGATAITKMLGKTTIASVLGNYDGMQVGFTLAK